jgi:hypothetical protein
VFNIATQVVSKAVVAKVLSARRSEVHERYVKMWAKKLLVSPELAAVPLKDVDGQLASKFEVGHQGLWWTEGRA